MYVSERECSGKGKSEVEMEGRSFIELWLGEKLKQGHVEGRDQSENNAMISDMFPCKDGTRRS